MVAWRLCCLSRVQVRVQNRRTKIESRGAAVWERFVARTHPPAAVPPFINDGHFDAARNESVRCSQSGETRTDHRDLRRHGLPLPQSRLTFSASARPHEVPAEHLVNLFLRVTAVEQELCDERITRHVLHLCGEFWYAVEVGADAGVVDAGHLHDVVDVVHDVAHVAGRVRVVFRPRPICFAVLFLSWGTSSAVRGLLPSSGS